MICIADKKADIGRYVVISNMLKLFPTHEVVYLSAADFSKMTVPKEWLYILGHGSPDTMGDGYTPTQLAKELLSRGLKNYTKIEVRACSSGVPSSLTGLTYVTALVDQIRLQSKAKVTVYAQGFSGTGVIQSEGSYLAKDAIKNDVHKKKEYTDIINSTIGQREIADATQFIHAALSLGTPIKDIAQGVVNRTTQTFASLYSHNLTVTKKPETGLSSSSLEEYIRSFDTQWLNDSQGSNVATLIEGVRWQSVYEWATTVPPNTNVFRVLSGQNLLS